MEELTRRVDEDVGRRPGFVAYEFIDCRDREMITLSAFRDADEAEASRSGGPRRSCRIWSSARLAALRREILVSRAARDLLSSGAMPDPRGEFASAALPPPDACRGGTRPGARPTADDRLVAADAALGWVVTAAGVT